VRIMRNVNHTFNMSAHVLENERAQFNEHTRNSIWKVKKPIMLLPDTLVYELYFSSKFHKDKLYPAPKPYLLVQIEKIKAQEWVKIIEGRGNKH
jgi:hypothetical protein